MRWRRRIRESIAYRRKVSSLASRKRQSKMAGKRAFREAVFIGFPARDLAGEGFVLGRLPLPRLYTVSKGYHGRTNKMLWL